jgi:hypothetical protein
MTEPNSGGNFYFLLKTENIQPLVKTIDEFAKQIDQNQATINAITKHIDTKFLLPNDDETENPDDQNDPLRYILNQKYHLKGPEDEKSPVYHKNPKINQLIKDNIHLAKLKQQKLYKNNQLLQTIHDYESFIVEQILPCLREDLVGMDSPDFVNYKYSIVREIYARYNMNLHYLSKLIDLFHGMFEFLKQYDDVHYRLLHQFEVLVELQRNLNSKVPLIERNLSEWDSKAKPEC